MQTNGIIPARGNNDTVVMLGFDKKMCASICLGTGESVGKHVPTEEAVGVTSSIYRMFGIQCEAVMLQGELVFETEFYFFPEEYWNRKRSESDRPEICKSIDMSVREVREMVRHNLSCDSELTLDGLRRQREKVRAEVALAKAGGQI